jgi:phenylacetate-CoA ligase
MYFEIYKTILSPFYDSFLKGRNINKYKAILEERQYGTYENLFMLQWAGMRKLLNHAYYNVPFWHTHFDKLNMKPEDFKRYDDLLRVPIIGKGDFRKNYDSMLATNYIGKTWKKSTGGSTGEPLHFEYTPESYDRRVAASKRGYSWAGCEDGMKQAYIWGTAIGEVPLLKKLKEDLHHAILRQKYFNCFKFDEREMARTLKELNRFKPEIIIGYTNPLYEFARFVSDQGNLKFRPKSIISAAEKLHGFQRDLISKVFGCGVFDTYGSREFMLIAAECEERNGLHISMENLYVEVIKEDGSPAKPGEMGELVITDLHNYGMPFIRYKIGDMAIISDRKCKCGRNLPLLEEVVGRSLDVIKTPDGKYVPGEFFPHLMKEFPEVLKFRVVQDKLNEININIVKSGVFADNRVNAMKHEIDKVTGTGMSVLINFVDDIPLTATGKTRVTVSNLGKG